MSITAHRKKAIRAGLVAGLSAAVAAVLVGGAPLGRAEVRITVPGASPDYEPVWLQGRFGKTPQQYAQFNTQIGEGWFPGTTPEVVQYPASIGILSGSINAPDADQSLAIGQAGLNSDITNAVATGHPVVVAGLSMGTIVIDREQAYLATDPNAPSPRQLTFIEFAPPARGLGGTYIPPGYTVPVVDYTQVTPPESQYQTIIVYTQYDLWSNPPDRPWNLIADANAVLGAIYYHAPTPLAVPANAVEQSVTTNSLGGKTTTYMIPQPNLPLLQPLRNAGVPAPIVDELNAALTPVVNSGYSSATPNAGPYFSRGALVFPGVAKPNVKPSLRFKSAALAAPSAPKREGR